MSRRGASLSDPARWVFNRLAADYRARPGYPAALVARVAALAGGPGARAADLGAGAGALAVPLARARLTVHAVEPARAMLDELAADAGVPRLRPACGRAQPALSVAAEGRVVEGLGMNGPGVVPVHAAAEETGLPAGAFDLVVLADALQWIDPDRGAREAQRLLAPGGVLAVVTPRLADTPFLQALSTRIARANFKARPAPPPVGLFFSTAGLPAPEEEDFRDEVALAPDRLDAVLRSLSYVGPAIGPAALQALLADARALAAAHGGAVWRREITVAWSRRAR